MHEPVENSLFLMLVGFMGNFCPDLRLQASKENQLRAWG